MEIFEKINRAFGSWYEGLFGGSDDVRPKDILRRVFVAMEENRKEHLDDRVYVPNHYVLEIAVDDEDEKEYLRSFLVREELETAIRRYCKQNHYEIRGGLQFTIREVEPDGGDAGRARREKVRVRARYDSTIPAPAPAPVAVAAGPDVASRTGPGPAAAPAQQDREPAENATVFQVDFGDDEPGTVPAVAYGRLSITPPGKPSFDYTLAKAAVTIGRSARAGNDIVVEDDKVSRRHARIELESDGRFTIYDLDTTNGTRVNGKRVDNTTLTSGDEVGIGDTAIRFQRLGDGDVGVRDRPAGAVDRAYGAAAGRAPRLVLMDGDRDVEEYVLASETIIGRASTNDIVLADRSVATRHAAVKRECADAPHVLEILDANHMSLLNGSQLRPGSEVELYSGDRIGLGTVTLRFEETER